MSCLTIYTFIVHFTLSHLMQFNVIVVAMEIGNIHVVNKTSKILTFIQTILESFFYFGQYLSNY